MEMCYDGALVMPSNYAVMSEDEMTYVEGGKTTPDYGTAKELKQLAGSYMAAWFSLGAGYSVAAASAVASAVGATVGVIAGLGAAHHYHAGNLYKEAYNYFSLKSQKSKKKYKMITISFLGAITGVSFSEK